jgi:hypothetical protein
VEETLPDAERIRCEWLFRVHLDAIQISEVAGADPGRVQEHGVLTDLSNCGLQVQAAQDGDGLNVVPEPGHDTPELPDSLRVRPIRQPDEDPRADTQNVASVQGPWCLYKGQRPVGTKCRGDGGDFGAAGLRTGTGKDGNLGEHNGRVLDKDGIRQLGCRREPKKGAAELDERLLIQLVLRNRTTESDGTALHVRELAANDARWDSSGQRD